MCFHWARRGCHRIVLQRYNLFGMMGGLGSGIDGGGCMTGGGGANAGGRWFSGASNGLANGGGGGVA